MTVYVECEDPRVLAEHQGCGHVQIGSQVPERWERSSKRDADEFSRTMAKGWRYRLVFPDAEAAGKGLVDYRDRLGARVLIASEPGMALFAWVGEEASGAIAWGLDHGYGFRVAAPAEEPRPEVVMPVGLPDARLVLDDGCACIPDVHHERGCPADQRPRLPADVQPVAWSDSEQAWVINGREVPGDWEWSTGFGSGWRNDDEAWRRLWLVLARPVPVPPEPCDAKRVAVVGGLAGVCTRDAHLGEHDFRPPTLAERCAWLAENDVGIGDTAASLLAEAAEVLTQGGEQ